MHTSSCPQCGGPMGRAVTTCPACGTEFTSLQQDWVRVQQDFQAFRQEMHTRFSDWEKEMDAFRAQLFPPAPEVVPVAPLPVVPRPGVFEKPPLEQQETVLSPLPTPQPKFPEKEEPVRAAALVKTGETALEEQGWVPFPRIFEYIGRTYRHYQEGRKLPVFFMTLGGIVALLFGFGYLMQLGVDWMLSTMSPAFFEGLKISTGLTAGFALIGWGWRLWKKDDPYREFGSALQGLGLALNYLSLYFLTLSSYFPFFGRFEVGLSLVALNAALGVWLALRHETRIVAILSLIGGGLAPLYLHQSGNLLFYLGFVFTLCVAAIWLARKIKWSPLAVVAFWVALAAQHWTLFMQEAIPSLVGGTVALHAFAYLFFFYALLQQNKPRRKLSQEHILLLIGALFVWMIDLGMLWGETENWEGLGLVLICNAVIWLGAGIASVRPAFQHIRRLGFLIGGSLLGMGLLLLLAPEFWSLALGLEGLMLLLCGYWYRQEAIRWEAWVLLGLAALKAIGGLVELFLAWDAGLWQAPFVQWLALGAFFPALKLILKRENAHLSPNEQQFQAALNSVWAMWGLVVWHLATVWYVELHALNLALVPLAVLTWMGLKQDQKFLEFVGLLHLIAFPIAYVLSVVEVGDTLFMFQTIPGKLGGLELMLCLWGLVAWFGFWKKPEASYPALQFLREFFFFLIPLVGLPMVFRFYPDWAAASVWAAALATYGLGKWRGTAWSPLVCMLICMGAFGLSWHPLNSLTLIWGAVVLAGIMVGEQAYDPQADKPSPYLGLFKASIYYVGFLIGLLLVKFGGIEAIPLAGGLVSAYCLLLAYKGTEPAWLNQQRKLFYVWGVIIWFLSLVAWALFIVDQPAGEGGPFNWLAFFVLWSVLGKYLQHLFQVPEISGAWKAETFFSQLLLMLAGALTLVFWGWILSGVGMTAWWLLHGVFLLFLASQRKFEHLSKLGFTLLILAFAKLILVDFQQASVLTRILISLFSGGTLLLASRLFLKYREPWEETEEELKMEES